MPRSYYLLKYLTRCTLFSCCADADASCGSKTHTHTRTHTHTHKRVAPAGTRVHGGMGSDGARGCANFLMKRDTAGSGRLTSSMAEVTSS
jgi:hypothetical protein